MIVEKEKPTAVRRNVSFASAMYEGSWEVEGIEARRVGEPGEALDVQKKEEIPVVAVGDFSRAFARDKDEILIDARMLKKNPEDINRSKADIVIGLGPGFKAGKNVDAVIETCRGHYLGRAIYEGEPAKNTGKPGEIAGFSEERVIHSDKAGTFTSEREIGEKIGRGEIIGEVAGRPLKTGIEGIIRGLIKPGLEVGPGQKLADIDPRSEREYVNYISDKSLAVGGGVLEAIFHLS